MHEFVRFKQKTTKWREAPDTRLIYVLVTEFAHARARGPDALSFGERAIKSHVASRST